MVKTDQGGHRDLYGEMEVVYIFIGVVVTQVLTSIDTQCVYLKVYILKHVLSPVLHAFYDVKFCNTLFIDQLLGSLPELKKECTVL